MAITRTRNIEKGRGFTLIELLVVIAIIGVLSSVVLASLNTARTRSRDAAIRSQVLELRKVYELEYSETGSYDALKALSQSGNTWFSNTTQCQSPYSGFTGTNGATAKSICANLISTACVPSIACAGFGYTSPASSQAYSIVVYLPGESARAGGARWLCVGSSGATSISTGGWTEAGCSSNP